MIPTEFLHSSTLFAVLLRLVAALLIGGLIGLERSHRGHAAGFRTHALVCLSTSMLMLVTFDMSWLPATTQWRLQLDPTRLAQGIMTGIGFLGAGTIVKEGLTVQGLTTAASIWTTATIGILIGVGLYLPATLGALLTLGVLSLFHRLEKIIPTQFHGRLTVRFKRTLAPSEQALCAQLEASGFSVRHVGVHVDANDDYREYQMTISGARGLGAQTASAVLSELPGVENFCVIAAGE